MGWARLAQQRVDEHDQPIDGIRLATPYPLDELPDWCMPWRCLWSLCAFLAMARAHIGIALAKVSGVVMMQYDLRMRGWRRAACVVGLAALLATSSGACAGSILLEHPSTFVSIRPGLWVVTDYDYPIYYYEGFYWGLYGGVWYRRTDLDMSWVRVVPQAVPLAVVRIRHDRYVHYRPQRSSTVHVRRGYPPTRVHKAARSRSKARVHRSRPRVRRSDR